MKHYFQHENGKFHQVETSGMGKPKEVKQLNYPEDTIDDTTIGEHSYVRLRFPDGSAKVLHRKLVEESQDLFLLTLKDWLIKWNHHLKSMEK